MSDYDELEDTHHKSMLEEMVGLSKVYKYFFADGNGQCFFTDDITVEMLSDGKYLIKAINGWVNHPHFAVRIVPHITMVTAEYQLMELQ